MCHEALPCSATARQCVDGCVRRAQVIDERMSKGLWNAGLLSTQAGTIGRLCGNLLLSLCARITGAMTLDQINAFARQLYGLGGASMIFSLAYHFSVFGSLLG